MAKNGRDPTGETLNYLLIDDLLLEGQTGEITYVVCDLEFQIAQNDTQRHPVEIYAAALDPDLAYKPGFTYHSITNPEVPVKFGKRRRQNSVKQQDLESAASGEDALQALEFMLAGSRCIFVAHAGFHDRAMVNRLITPDSPLHHFPWIDTYALAKTYLPPQQSYQLRDLAKALKIPMENGLHRAQPDVEITIEILKKIILAMKSNGANKLSDLLITGQLNNWLQQPLL